MDAELIEVLTKFRHDIASDTERILNEKFEREFVPFKREVYGHFDAIYKRFDRLEDEYQELRAAVGRLDVSTQSKRR